MAIRPFWIATCILVFVVSLSPSFTAAAEEKRQDAAASAPAAKDLVPLKIEIPHPDFGTPLSVDKSNHLDPNHGDIHAPRKPFLVPKDVVNVSFGKKVTSSDKEEVVGELSVVTDGRKEGRDGGYVELVPGTQWVQVDLKKSAEIYAIITWREPICFAAIYRDVIVQISDDPEFAKDIKTVFNNDYDNSSRLGVGTDYEYMETNEGHLVDAKGIKGRYVRCYSNGTQRYPWKRIVEVEVHGRPTK